MRQIRKPKTGMVGKRFKLIAVLLAAGASTRMGRPKMLLPWGNKTILSHSIQAWSRLADDTSVIYSSADHPIQAELDRLHVLPRSRIPNPDSSRGMFSSIQTAARWTGWPENVTHWAIILGDQPHVSVATLRRLVQFAQEFPEFVCQPGREGKERHPVEVELQGGIIYFQKAARGGTRVQKILQRRLLTIAQSQKEFARDHDRMALFAFPARLTDDLREFLRKLHEATERRD